MLFRSGVRGIADADGEVCGEGERESFHTAIIRSYYRMFNQLRSPYFRAMRSGSDAQAK